MIKNAMKSRNKVELQAYQNLKTEIQKFKTAKNAKPYDENAEMAIISKYCKSLEDAIKQFSEAHREDLVAAYTSELEVLKKLLPEPVDASQIWSTLVTLGLSKGWVNAEEFANNAEKYQTLCIPKKEMGTAIKYIKSKFPTADGKIISEIVKKYIV